MKTETQKTQKTQIYYHGEIITFECKEFNVLSCFLFHLCNSLQESKNVYLNQGFEGLAGADSSLRQSLRLGIDKINNKD